MLRKTTLANGLRVITDQRPTYRMVHVNMCFGVGSGWEGPTEWGAAHFLEHLVAVGESEEVQHRLACQMADMGGLLQAETDIETCSFKLDVPVASALHAFELLARHIAAFRVEPRRIEIERSVILEEIASSVCDKQLMGAEMLNQAIFGDVAHSVLGSVGSVKRLTPDILERFRQFFYTPDRLVIVAMGSIAHEAVVGIVEDVFGGLQRGATARRLGDGASPGRGRTKAKESPQQHLFCGWPIPGPTSAERHVLSLLWRALAGDGTDVWARLFQRLRTRSGLVYTIGGYQQFVGDRGLLAIYAETNGDWRSVLQEIHAEIEAVRCQGFRQEELVRASRVIFSTLCADQDVLSRQAERLVRRTLLGQPDISVDEEGSLLSSMSISEVKSVAEQFLDFRRAVIVTTN